MLRWSSLVLSAASLTACVDIPQRVFVGGEADVDRGPGPVDPDAALDGAPVDVGGDLGVEADGGDAAVALDVGLDGAVDGAVEVDLGVEVDLAVDAGVDGAVYRPCGVEGVYFAGPSLCLMPTRIGAGLLSPRSGHTMTRVGESDAFVLVGGERRDDVGPRPLAERLEIRGDEAVQLAIEGLDEEWAGHDAAWIGGEDGLLMVAGGRLGGAVTRGIAVFDPAMGAFSMVNSSLARGHDGGSLRVGYNAHAFVIGGVSDMPGNARAEMWTLRHRAAEGWEFDHYHDDVQHGSMPFVARHVAVQVGPGQVVWGGGVDGDGLFVDRWAHYDADEIDRAVYEVFGGGPAVADAAAVALDDGVSRFAIFGGVDAAGPWRGAAVHDVGEGSWTVFAGDAAPRDGLTASRIGDAGWVVLIGGNSEAPVELVRFEADRITRYPGRAAEGPLWNNHFGHRAARLSDGRVLVTGGHNDRQLTDALFVVELVPAPAR